MKKLITSLFLSVCSFSVFAFNATISITTSPSDAKIYFGDQLYGTGTATLYLSSPKKIQLKVEREGYITFVKNYLYNGGSKFSNNTMNGAYERGQNNFTITLVKDEKYINPLDVSVKSDSINSFLVCIVDPKFNSQDAWKKVLNVVSDYFDDMEKTKTEAGTLKTEWKGQVVGNKKIRTRLIIKTDNENPLTYKIKLQSEYSDFSSAYENDDVNFKEWDRILKKYKNLVTDFYKELGKK